VSRTGEKLPGFWENMPPEKPVKLYPVDAHGRFPARPGLPAGYRRLLFKLMKFPENGNVLNKEAVPKLQFWNRNL
jgi:hypothetical protein